ncbi:hypothetical protein IKE71_02795 [Candidatus Saccharibacteria bacterium]|nr:hypothetical protein [Candidatus Saccharibacteria bacterium]
MTTREILKLGWPRNLLIYVLGSKAEINLPLSDAQEAEINNAINELARPEWREVIPQAFKEQMHPSKIGENYNMSTSRAQKMVSDAVYHLKNPLFAHRITTGTHSENEHSLEPLCLSNRVYIRLRRNGIYSIEQLKAKTALELLSISKLGKIGVIEIADALREYDGSEIPDPENVLTKLPKTGHIAKTEERDKDVAEKKTISKAQSKTTIIKTEPGDDENELIRTLDAMNKVIDGLFVLSSLDDTNSIGYSVYKEVEKAFDDGNVSTSYLRVLYEAFKKIRQDTFADKIDYNAICQQAKAYLA